MLKSHCCHYDQHIQITAKKPQTLPKGASLLFLNHHKRFILQNYLPYKLFIGSSILCCFYTRSICEPCPSGWQHQSATRSQETQNASIVFRNQRANQGKGRESPADGFSPFLWQYFTFHTVFQWEQNHPARRGYCHLTDGETEAGRRNLCPDSFWLVPDRPWQCFSQRMLLPD